MAQNKSQEKSQPVWKNEKRSEGLGFLPSLLEDFIPSIFGQSSSGLSVSENKQNIFVEAAMPGLKPEDIDLHLDRGTLTIKGEKKEEKEDKDKKFYRRASRSFSYRLNLPEEVDETNEPQAVYKDGIMKITFAKTQKSQGKKINVKEG